MVSLDGGNRIVGTEFIKLLNTGSSDLATEEYVLEQVALGGGGVQPEDVYTKAEADALLNAKLNVNNPQDVIGTLRLDPTNGLSKIILNAVGAPNDEDFYVNGNGYINSEMRASSMKCDNTLTFASIKGNFISNNDANTDLKFQINTNDFITLSTANDVIEVDKDIEMHSSTLKSDVLDTWSNASLQIRRNGINYISLDGDDTISISRQSKIGSNKADGVDMTVSHYNNTTNLFEKKLSFKNGNEIFATGDGGVDEELLLNYYTDAGVRIGNATDAYLTIKGARNGTNTLTVNGDTYFGGAVSYNGDIVLTNPYKLKSNTISSNGLNDLVFEIDTLGEFFRCQASDFTVRLPNNRSFLSQNITVDNLQPLSFGNDLVLNGGNSTNDAYEEYIRLDASAERVNVSKIIDTSENILMNLNKRLYLNDTVGSERYIVSTFRSGTPSFNQLDIVNENSSNGRIRLMINTEENVIIENTQLYSKRVITAVAGVKGNTYNSNGDNDVLFQRDNVEFFKLDKFTEDTVEKEAIICSKQLRANGIILVKNLQINQISTGIEYADFRVENFNNSVMRFFVGNSTSVNLQISQTATTDEISLNRNTKCSGTFYTNNIDTYTDTNLIFRRNGTTFLTLDDTDGVKASQSITVEGADDYVYTNNLRHNTGTNLNIWTLSTTKFYSNASNKMEIKQTQIDINEDVVFASGKGLTVPEIFTYNYDTNGTLGDVIWAYNNTPYMFYDASETSFAFMVDVISNFEFSGTAFNVVSDERKKENIENVDVDCSEIVKSIEVKTFNYKDDKKKKNIGYIAQDVKKKVPSKFEAVVSDYGDYMGLDYGKMSAILWKALQEEMAKTEYLESKLFETIARVEALEKPKKRTTTKTTT